MEIVVRQISGLGNQLFQYAAGRSYARMYGANLRIAVEPEEKAHSYGHPRPFLLKHFKIAAPCTEITETEKFALTTNKIVRPLSMASNRLRSIQVVREPWAERYDFHPDLRIRRSTRIAILAGYWQVHNLADSIEQELRSELKLASLPSGANQKMLLCIESAKTAVSLHIRRGDYTHPSEGNIALPLSYYLKSIRLMEERFSAPTFFVFSDDMDYAKAHLPTEANLVFVDHNNAATADEDLRLMSSCSHHVIANSTLSWWGAWLNPNQNKVVFAPKRWRVGGCTETPDLFPPSWQLLEDD